MANSNRTGDRAALWLRWIARVLGSFVGLYWLGIAIISIVTGEEEWTLESTFLTILVGVAIVGVAIAWWREGIGGLITVISGLALSVFAFFSASFNKVFAMVVSGGPFFVAGLLFLASWWRSSRR